MAKSLITSRRTDNRPITKKCRKAPLIHLPAKSPFKTPRSVFIITVKPIFETTPNGFIVNTAIEKRKIYDIELLDYCTLTLSKYNNYDRLAQLNAKLKDATLVISLNTTTEELFSIGVQTSVPVFRFRSLATAKRCRAYGLKRWEVLDISNARTLRTYFAKYCEHKCLWTMLR